MVAHKFTIGDLVLFQTGLIADTHPRTGPYPRLTIGAALHWPIPAQVLLWMTFAKARDRSFVSASCRPNE